LGLLHELVPTATIISALLNPSAQRATDREKELHEAAVAIGQRVHILKASNDTELDAAFVTFVQQRAQALLVGGDPFFDSRRNQIIAFAVQHRTPTMYPSRDYAVAGGLISYGPNFTDGYHQVGAYTGRILKGEKPADLPVMQSTVFELVINLKTAKTLGLAVPPALLARADEVIE
jgi:ABC-type uncharacterized transport system substrate-binding protein